jgi:hypothetical protein
MRYRISSPAGILFGVGLAAVVGLLSPLARADEPDGLTRSTPTSAPYLVVSSNRPSPRAGESADTRKRYFVEFRARNAAFYGHLYVLYGEVDGRQEIISSHIAGFFPAGDTRDCENCSVYNAMIGFLIFVPSEIGVSDGDLEERYVVARYRIWLDAANYKRLVAYIEQKKANKPLWNMLWQNCVGFGRDVAEVLNLKVPIFLWLRPQDFVITLRKANGVENAQHPLKETPGSLAAPTTSAAKTPSQTAKAHPAVTAQPSGSAPKT